MTSLQSLYKTGLDGYVVSTKEACRILDKDKATLGRWRDQGRIKAALTGDGPNGAHWYWRRDIEALAQERVTA